MQQNKVVTTKQKYTNMSLAFALLLFRFLLMKLCTADRKATINHCTMKSMHSNNLPNNSTVNKTGGCLLTHHPFTTHCHQSDQGLVIGASCKIDNLIVEP